MILRFPDCLGGIHKPNGSKIGIHRERPSVQSTAFFRLSLFDTTHKIFIECIESNFVLCLRLTVCNDGVLVEPFLHLLIVLLINRVRIVQQILALEFRRFPRRVFGLEKLEESRVGLFQLVLDVFEFTALKK